MALFRKGDIHRRGPDLGKRRRRRQANKYERELTRLMDEGEWVAAYDLALMEMGRLRLRGASGTQMAEFGRFVDKLERRSRREPPVTEKPYVFEPLAPGEQVGGDG